MAKVPRDRLDTVIAAWCRRQLFTPGGGPRRTVPAHVVEGLVADLAIDPAAEWQLTEGYLELHTKEQLVALAGELTDAEGFNAGGKRADLITWLLTAGPTRMPAEVAAARGE